LTSPWSSLSNSVRLSAMNFPLRRRHASPAEGVAYWTL
jgi:hypothetical protein